MNSKLRIPLCWKVVGTTDKRYTDATGARVPDKKDPWAASYTAPSVPAPVLAMGASLPWDKKNATIVIRAGATALPRVVIDVLDHHSAPMGNATRSVPANGRVVVKFNTPRLPEGVRIRVGEWSWDGLQGHGGDGGGLSYQTNDDVRIDEKDWAELHKGEQ